MRVLASFPIILLPIMITACQPQGGAPFNVTSNLDAETTEEILDDVSSQDREIEDVVNQITNDPDDAQAKVENSGDENAKPEITPPETLKPSLSPDAFIGLDIDQLKIRLGEPQFIRVDGAVEIYQYRLANCVIDFVAMPPIDHQGSVVQKSDDQVRMITSSHARHRVMNTAYDADACHLDLGSLDQTSRSDLNQS